MEPHSIDRATTEKMLSGSLRPGDMPGRYAHLAALLHAAAVSSAKLDPARDEQTIAAMVSAIGAGTLASAPTHSSSALVPEGRGRRRFLKTKLVAGLAVAMLLMGAGLAFAGELPPALQNTAASLLRHVGITVPTHSGGDGGVGPTGTSGNSQGAGPDVNGPAKYGLCTAFASGNGGASGGKNDSAAFKKLQDAADQAGQTVEQFCVGAVPGGKSPQGQGKGSGHASGPPSTKPGKGNGSGNGKGTGKGHSSDAGNGSSKSHAGGNPKSPASAKGHPSSHASGHASGIG